MNKNEVQISRGDWYEFVLDNDEKYIGKCAREPFLAGTARIHEVGFSCHKDNERKGYFYDLSIPLLKIRSIRKIKEVVEFTEK